MLSIKRILCYLGSGQNNLRPKCWEKSKKVQGYSSLGIFLQRLSRKFSKALESPDTEFFPIKIWKKKGAYKSGMKLKTGKFLVIDV